MKSLTVFTSPHLNAEVQPLVADLGIPVREVDIEQRPFLAAAYGVKTLPAFVLLEGDTILKNKAGHLTRQGLDQFIA